jgi:enoyl-CoA hydratase
MIDSQPEILFDRRGAAGIVTLNRPKALNAVTLAMVRALTRQLVEWGADPSITRVVVTAAGGRAFSAGGDIRALYDLGRAGRHAEMLPFWREEYILNVLIKRYPKPYVALIDGIVMGGGVGISAHGSHRIAGDRFMFAMPEVGIGFFPDVGATWLLPRLPGEIGTYCALTGERMNAADAHAASIVTDCVPSSRFGELIEALCESVPVDHAIAAFAQEPSSGALLARRPAIDRLFRADRVEEILAALDAAVAATDAVSPFAAATAEIMGKKSPTSLKIALAQMRAGRSLSSFEACMQTEFRIVSRIIHGHDFYEGVRAVIVDKDNAPRWRPSALDEVSQHEVRRHFASLGADELVVP